MAIQHDISASVRERDEIRQLAYHDSLTGLPNRALFLQLLGEAIGSADCERRRLAVLFLDLDYFKNVNDALGHAAGDRLLVAVAQPFALGEQKIETGVSIGIGLYPDDRDNAETLLVRADAAMYRAKTHGRGGFCFVSASKL